MEKLLKREKDLGNKAYEAQKELNNYLHEFNYDQEHEDICPSKLDYLQDINNTLTTKWVECKKMLEMMKEWVEYQLKNYNTEALYNEYNGFDNRYQEGFDDAYEQFQEESVIEEHYEALLEKMKGGE